MEPTEEQYLVLNALETLGILLFRVYDEERKEILQLARQVFGVQIKDGQVYCQGRTWKLSNRTVYKSSI